MDRRRLGRILVVTFVVSVVFRLAGFTELLTAVITSLPDTLDKVAAFWRPLLGTWVLLVFVVWLLGSGLRVTFDFSDHERTDSEVDFDRLTARSETERVYKGPKWLSRYFTKRGRKEARESEDGE